MRKSLTKNLKLVIRGTVSLLLLGTLLYLIDWRQGWEALLQMNPAYLTLAVFWIVIAVVVSVIKWGLILKAQGLEVPWRELWQAYWIGLFFNNFLPSSIGGDAVRILNIGNSTGDSAGAAYSVIVERTLATTALAMVGIIASVFAGEMWPGLRLFFIMILLVSSVLAGLLLVGKVPYFLQNRKGRVAGFLKGFISHGGRIGRNPKAIFWVIFWSVGFQMANVAVFCALFQGLGLAQVGWLQASLLVPAAGAIAMLPLGINGYGVREGAYVFLLGPLGVDKSLALTASLLFAFLVSFSSLWGGLLWLKGGRWGGLIHEKS
ncbi:MAG: flippase-like domain-containing protein [Firmicutes bacterium]|nr:flippase-like domain-containing protein [Bacillota bacterium]